MIDVLVPTYGRPDKLELLARNILEASRKVDLVTFVVEADDPASIAAVGAIGPGVRYIINTGPRSYAGAINTAAAHVDSPWLFTGADDLRYYWGWDTAALRLARICDAMVVGTNDLGHPAVLAGQHSTHSLVSMEYVKQGATADRCPGKVLHDYDHNWVDTELVHVARHRGVYAHCHTSLVEHLHPAWGKADSDATYTAGAANYDTDQAEFERRMETIEP